jgi:hypothetical protein
MPKPRRIMVVGSGTGATTEVVILSRIMFA